MSEPDYIGPDPVKWIDRLIEVNAGSSFPPIVRHYIDEKLRDLRVNIQPYPSGLDKQ